MSINICYGKIMEDNEIMDFILTQEVDKFTDDEKDILNKNYGLIKYVVSGTPVYEITKDINLTKVLNKVRLISHKEYKHFKIDCIYRYNNTPIKCYVGATEKYYNHRPINTIINVDDINYIDSILKEPYYFIV